jgi:hypothetical protein
VSGGKACSCDESTRAPQYRRWVVLQRYCNHSAFNGYHWTASAYSSIQCTLCRAIWRTKAKYVSLLKDGKVS